MTQSLKPSSRLMTRCVSSNRPRCSGVRKPRAGCPATRAARRIRCRCPPPGGRVPRRARPPAGARGASRRYGRSQELASNSNAWVVSCSAIQMRKSSSGTPSDARRGADVLLDEEQLARLRLGRQEGDVVLAEHARARGSRAGSRPAASSGSGSSARPRPRAKPRSPDGRGRTCGSRRSISWPKVTMLARAHPARSTTS